MHDPKPTAHGVAVWSTPEWRAEAEVWLDEQLERSGIERTGAVEQPRVRPWATVLKAPTNRGVVWMKAAAPATAFEVGLYELLAQTVPDRVLIPVAADVTRGWLLLPDGGEPIAARLDGTDLTDAFADAMAQYGQLQRDLAPHVGELLALGVTDMRPAVMPERLETALAVTASVARTRAADQERHEQVAAMRVTFASWCAELAASSVSASLDHNDFHTNNILGDGTGAARFYDWGDSVVAHPFAVMLVALNFLKHLLDCDRNDPRVRQARDTYLDGFRPGAPDEDLGATLELACRVGKVARALVWDRALQAAREQGEPIDDDWVTAPMETLFSLLDPA